MPSDLLILCMLVCSIHRCAHAPACSCDIAYLREPVQCSGFSGLRDCMSMYTYFGLHVRMDMYTYLGLKDGMPPTCVHVYVHTHTCSCGLSSLASCASLVYACMRAFMYICNIYIYTYIYI